jgi:hypothetical protein
MNPLASLQAPPSTDKVAVEGKYIHGLLQGAIAEEKETISIRMALHPDNVQLLRTNGFLVKESKVFKGHRFHDSVVISWGSAAVKPNE